MRWPFPMESTHPMVIHFPIALLLSGNVLDLIARLSKRPSLHRIALWNLTLGTLGAGLAVFTGLRAEDVAKHSFTIWQVMELHKRLGITTLVLGMMTVSWRLKQRDHLTRRARIVMMMLAVMMTGSLLWGAHLGGRLVYEFGVGGRFGASTE